MKMTSWISQLSHRRSTLAGCTAASLALATMMTGAASAQAPAAPQSSISAPEGYSIHHSVDLGGSMDQISGSKAMYNTMVNDHSGPRVLGENFELRALPGNKKANVDELSAFLSGFGGTTNNIARLNASKAKVYEFTSNFRRSRQYFDYDLLGNPNLLPNQTMPIGPSNAPTGTLAWSQVNHSPEMFNTVRRMLDTNLTLFPQSKLTYRFGYARNNFEGPTSSPSYSIAKYDALLLENQRNATDEYTLGVDWKPLAQTIVSLEGVATYYKADSTFTLDPNGFVAQEADGTKVYLGNWDSQTPYGIGACATTSMGTGYTSTTNYTIFSPANTPGGLPVINAACSVVTSYLRSQPTHIFTPTEMLRFQSSSIKHIVMNGDVRYTLAAMHLDHYYENFTGLDTGTTGGIRSITYNGNASGHRAVFATDYGIIWQPVEKFSLAESINYQNTQQPGTSYVPIATTLATPASAGNQTINYSGTLSSGNLVALPHGINGTVTPNFFGQTETTNNLTASYDVTDKLRLALTYRYGYHFIDRGNPHGMPIPVVSCDPVCGTLSINQNSGIFNVAYRPAPNWDVNATAEIGYADNVLSALAPRQTTQYKIRTKFRPKSWAILSAAFNDIEHHNNTNNNAAVVAAGTPYEGPLGHEDYTRTASITGQLIPSEHYGLDFSYAYTDTYNATNICFTTGASATTPGTATVNANGTAAVCPGIFARGSQTVLVDMLAKGYFDAPTQFASVAVMLAPVKQIKANLGYRITDVSGSQFFNDARNVNGALASTYQAPFAKLAWTLHPGLTWKAEYNYHNYAENGPSGPQYCSTTVSATATIVPCTSLSAPTGLTEGTSGLTAARAYHASNVTLGFHYEF